jgi:hypothetical protein
MGVTVRKRVAALLGAVVLTASGAGCTAVPSDSAPEVVQSLPAEVNGPRPVIVPPHNGDPRQIVLGFLDANAIGDPHHASARQFLTTEAKNRWSDSTVTVVQNPVVGNVDTHHRITVTGQEVGTIDASGVYTPALPGDGLGTDGVPVSPTFHLVRVHGQWRIDTLQNGLIVSAANFETQYFTQRVVYFFDFSGQRLVPDPRWTQLSGGSGLADWLMARLADGPRGSLQTAMPQQTDPKRVSVSFRADGLAVVQIPGASQLSAANRDLLAAQVSLTLSQVPQVSALKIVDGVQPVRIPAAGSAVFTPSDVAAPFRAPAPTGALYFVRRGAVYDETGMPLSGRLGSGAYALTSVAVAARPGTPKLQVAGTRGRPDASRLLIGTTSGLAPTSLVGRLSRPAWDPSSNELWIGDGARLYRVLPDGRVYRVQVTAAGGSATGRVAAVRVSPEGARIALVLTNPDGTSQLWVGAIDRAPSSVRVDDLSPISPQGVAVSDVAWNDQLKLFTIGRDTATGLVSVFELQCDGSRWTERGTLGLPQAPDSVTVAEGQVAAVSAGGTVWKQQAGAWVSLLGGQTFGTNPVYTE